ncbi:MAG: Sjogren's syndrome/scleroderma autoantigen 1 family protein [Candidatus Hermodarchaeia archaeon]|jgi:hypothetical protein
MSDNEVTKRMGQLLRKGAALLNTACPKCNTPLLRLKDGSVASSGELQISGAETLNQLASKVLVSIELLIHSFPEKPHTEEIRAFAKTARDLVEILKRIQEVQT